MKRKITNLRGILPHSMYIPSLGADLAKLNSFLKNISSICSSEIIPNF